MPNIVKLQEVLWPTEFGLICSVLSQEERNTVADAYVWNPELVESVIRRMPSTADDVYLRNYLIREAIEPYQRAHPRTPTLGDLLEKALRDKN